MPLRDRGGEDRALDVLGASVVGALCLTGLEVVVFAVRWPEVASPGELARMGAVAALIGAGLGLVAGGGWVAVRRAWLAIGRRRGKPLWIPSGPIALLSAALAIAGTLVDALAFVNLYPDAHALLGFATIAAATGGAAIGLRRTRLAALAGVGILGALAAYPAVGAIIGGRHGTRHHLVARTAIVGRTVAWLWPASAGRGTSDCQWPPPGPATGRAVARGASVLIVTIDAFRGDAGGTRLHDALPKTMARLPHAVRFDRAYAPAPRTTYSTYSMLTGVFPHRLGFVAATTDTKDRFIPLDDDDPIMIDPTKWKLRHRYPLGDRTPTIAGMLGGHGYDTAAVISDVSLLPAAGITREFGTVDPAPYHAVGRRDLGGVTSDTSTAAGLVYLDQRPSDTPYLLWLHYRDPHHPYTAYPPVTANEPAPVRYFSELRRVDDAVDRLLEAVALDRTIVVVTGDHGEEFRDHGGQFHGTTLYEELIHVPLVVAVPGAAAAVSEEPVSLTDLVPTLLDLLGITDDSGRFDGQSFAGLIVGEPWVRRPIFAYNTSYTARFERQAAVIDGAFKLVEDEGAGTLQLFDLDGDPLERANVADIETATADRLRCLISATGALATQR